MHRSQMKCKGSSIPTGTLFQRCEYNHVLDGRTLYPGRNNFDPLRDHGGVSQKVPRHIFRREQQEHAHH